MSSINGHRGWHTLHGEGRRLVSDNEQLVVKCQVRQQCQTEQFGNRFIEVIDRERNVSMCLAFDHEWAEIGKTFGRTQNEARSAMEALFARKGLGTSGLTFKGKHQPTRA